MAAQIGLAEVPNTITYQGRLTDASGDPVPDGEYNISFSLYTVSSGGSPIWGPEVPKPFWIIDGLFTWELGSVEEFPDGFFYDNFELYLGITVESEPEIDPRTRLNSTPYALHALKSDSAIYASQVLPNSVNSSHIVDYSITKYDIQDETITGSFLQTPLGM